MSVGRSGSNTLFNDTWMFQSRNANPGASGDGTPNEVIWSNILEEVVDAPISPPRGVEWDVYQIDWSWFVASEDDSDSNLSEHLTGLFEISEDDNPTLTLKGGGNLDTLTFGNARGSANSDQDIQANVNDGPWVSVMSDCVANHHNDANGQSGGASNIRFQGSFEPPDPITIGSRTALDMHTAYVFPMGTSVSGEESLIHGGTATVWYKERDVNESIR